MESASDIVEHIINLGSDADMAEKLCVARDAAIRAECADRAVAWCKKWAEFPTGNHGTSALRAAIEGVQDA